MRRFIALIIMLIIPLQSAWSATAGLNGHLGNDATVVGTHAHSHDYHNADLDLAVSGSVDNDHNKDGHHGSHCHHVLSFLLHQPSLIPGLALSAGPILHPHAAFFSHTPPLFDRPPLARA
jgi:hypothetical protein